MSDTGYPDFINREKQQLLKEAAEMEISCKRIIQLADKVIDGREIYPGRSYGVDSYLGRRHYGPSGYGG